MKKILFSLMALALCAMMFTSCKKDKNDDDESGKKGLASITATGDIKFSAIAGAKLSTNASGTGTKINIAELLGRSDTRTSIVGINDQKQAIFITVNGTEAGTYNFGLNVQKTDATQLLIEYLTNGSIKETVSDLVDANTGCFIVYKASENATEGSSDYYVSTNATVNMNAPLKVGSIGYISGSYNATLQSGTGDSKKVINITGEFNCPAYNSTQQ